MPILNFQILTAVILITVIALAFTIIGQPDSHRVFINGQVISVDSHNQIYEALSIRGDRIEKLGSNAEIKQLISTNTHVTDLNGKTIVPGFIDAHSHFPLSGVSAIATDISQPPIGTIASISDLIGAIQQAALNTPPGDWVLGFAYDDSQLQEQRHPTRWELDAVTPNHPVYLWHSSGHMGVANSRALERIGIDETSKAPVGGIFGKNSMTGALNGLLQETAALTFATFSKDLALTDYYRILRSATKEYASHGITTAQSGGIDEKMIKALSWASRLKLIPFRLIAFPNHEDLGEQILDGSFNPDSYHTDYFRVGPVKIIADGSIQGRTAYLSQPYHTNPPDNPDYRGFPTYPQAQLDTILSRYHQKNIQMAIHGNGDAAIDAILGALSKAQQQHPVTDPRLILVHAQTARADQLDDMLKLGVTPSFFPTHTYFWGDQHLRLFLGPDRAPQISPTGSAAKIGLKFSVHTDAPVTPINTMGLLNATVTRQSLSGKIIGTEQTISAYQALRAMTIDAAWQIFQEQEIGSLEPGKIADLVIW